MVLCGVRLGRQLLLEYYRAACRLVFCLALGLDRPGDFQLALAAEPRAVLKQDYFDLAPLQAAALFIVKILA